MVRGILPSTSRHVGMTVDGRAPAGGSVLPCRTMERIGVQDLRRYASRWLARVRAGETFIVTDRGRPVARLTPYEEELGYERLVREGRIAPGTGCDIEGLLAALDAELPPDEGPPLTRILLEMRVGER